MFVCSYLFELDSIKHVDTLGEMITDWNKSSHFLTCDISKYESSYFIIWQVRKKIVLWVIRKGF